MLCFPCLDEERNVSEDLTGALLEIYTGLLYRDVSCFHSYYINSNEFTMLSTVPYM